MIVKVLQTVWVIFSMFAFGNVPLFEPYAVQFPNATTRQITEMHIRDYKFKLTHWLHGNVFSWNDYWKVKLAEKTIRTMSLVKQAEYKDYLTEKMVEEPVLNEFIDMALLEIQNKTKNTASASIIGNMAYLLLHTAPSKQQRDILAWFIKE